MSWMLRHAGSPRALSNLCEEQVLEALRDGDWEGRDEIRTDNDADWQALENHPHWVNAVASLEESRQPAPLLDLEEQRIDMNPLIDVCLVLLVFFILATTVQVMERVLPLPTNRAHAARNIPEVSPEEVRTRMIVLQMRAGAHYRVDGQVIEARRLPEVLGRVARATGRRELVIDAREVSWGEVVFAIDAASAAELRRVHFKVNE